MRFALLRRTFPALLMAVAFGAALPALARDGGRDHRGGDHESRYDRDDRRWAHGDRRHERWDDRYDRRHARWDDRHDRRHARWDDRYDRRHGRWDDRYDRRHRRWDDRYDRRYDRHRGGYIVTAPRVIYRSPPRWSRGYRIHDYGWAPTYVVVDYGRYGLRHPPRGHHWRQDDRGNRLLVAIATGIVVDAILND